MVHLEPHPRGWLNSPSTRLQLKATSDCVWNVSGKGLGVVIERISRCPIHSGTISCKIDDAGSHEINGVRRRDVLNCFGAAISMELVAGSSPISSPFIEAANAADLIQRRQRSDFQSSIKMTLYKAIKANPELISPLLTLALNDSMTYDKPTKTRGPNGSIRFSSEIERPENKGLSAALSMVEEAKKEIDSYSKGGPISYSDLIQLAGLK
uniref:Plant heme peroxidase family profile domain-containing protein n=1 Tax=Lactuca sativa TaxID=4236 RepID=A0A9R1XVY8_LACSA|nr:hypothetical protein LSAT_V11C100037380 [Lactuca sativa]